MKKNSTEKMIVSVLAAGCLVFAHTPTHAGSVVINNQEQVDAMLQGKQLYFPNSPTGNTIEINNTSEAALNFKDATVNGGYDNNNDVTYNTVYIKDSHGSSMGIYGGYTKSNRNHNASNNKVTIIDSKINANIVGGSSESGNANNNIITIDNSVIFAEIGTSYIIGGEADNTANNNKIIISNSTINSDKGGFITAGSSDKTASNNEILIEDSNIIGAVTITGGSGDTVTNNTITIKGNSHIDNVELYGSEVFLSSSTSSNNKLNIDNWQGTVSKIANFEQINLDNIDLTDTNHIIANSTYLKNLTTLNFNSIKTTDVIGDLDLAKGKTKVIAVFTGANLTNKVNYGADLTNDIIAIDPTGNGVRVHSFDKYSNTNDTITATVDKSIRAGKYIGKDGKALGSGTLTIDNNFSTNANIIAGAYAARNSSADGGTVNISIDYAKDIYAGYSESKIANNNTINILNPNDNLNAANLNFYGTNDENRTNSKNNTLNIEGNNVTVNSINRFDNINLTDVDWVDGGTVLTILNNNGKQETFKQSDITLTSIRGGNLINKNDRMTLITGKNLDVDPDKINISDDFYAGVTGEGSGKLEVDADGIDYIITDIHANPQTMLIATNRAVTAAFVNQGSDLISEGLDSLVEQEGYGLKTFAAVYGNRSKYDVNSDLKINGWSEIIGIGRTEKLHDGNLDWGLFFENGSGNYRTYNKFNDEFFRGDGSLLYNGGGIAAR